MNSKDNATKKEKNKKKRNPFRFFLFDFVKVTGALSVLIWLRPKFLFENKKAKKHIRGGAIAIGNHTHFTDPVSLYIAFWYRRVHLLAIEDLFERKIFNWFFTHVLCIPVKRNDFNIDAFHASMEVLEEGGVLGIFPEGSLNTDKTHMKSFKSGAVLMAIKGRVPIVPVYIVPPKKWYNRVVLVMGEPIYPEELCGGVPNIKVIDEISQKLREREIKLKEIYNKWKTKKS